MEDAVVLQLMDAINANHWAVVAGLGLTILVWIARCLFGQKKLPPKYVPLINAAVAVVLAIADYLTRDVPWYTALATGLVVGATAGGFWSILGKHVLPLPDKPPE